MTPTPGPTVEREWLALELTELRRVAWGRAERIERERREFPWRNPTAIYMDVSYVQALALCADEEWDIDPIHN